MNPPEPSSELDARYLPPPEPFLRVRERLASLPRDACLRLLLFREPFPLYEALDRDGYRHTATLHEDGTFDILIWRPTA